ncbi:putative two-component system sensor protein histidine kinase [Mucinivorans hirudinis]|uniref:Putative two-component system sensor protein histidine kinase n=1 Tax=Mucinivorans hirudinis TaxID=1433126 RepID=A0A060R7U0_9BACT|nr:putative two-component system sensor protein histidine kinase [Mucinivorans hirudinis]
MWRRVSHQTRLIVALAVVVLLLRVVFIDLYRTLNEAFGLQFSDFLVRVVSDYPTFFVAFMLDLLFVRQLSRNISYGTQPVRRLLLICGYVVIISVVVAMVVNIGKIPFLDHKGDYYGEMLFSLLSALTINSLIVVVADVTLYYRQTRQELIAQINKKRKAQYQYSQLKRQLNPHFLFNSLNILDYIVKNGETERASAFIHKLAGTYRYLLSKEDDKLVTLGQELAFVEMYCDLLKERFTDGLVIEICIDESLYKTKIVPCGLQILVENATKHNIVSAEKPLTVRIFVLEHRIVVVNNLQPKLTQVDSTGLGLRNIGKQYLDIANLDIVIVKNEKEFRVELPILEL